MNILTLCLIFTDLFFFTHSRNLTLSNIRYFIEVENLFCLKSSSTPSTLPTIISDIPVLPPEEPSEKCCGDCSSDVKNCDLTDSCCTEALRPGNYLNVRMTCDYTQLRPNKGSRYPNLAYANLMFRDCPNVQNTTMDVISKCENSHNYEEIYTKTPVTDAKTMYIYKNRYCALCHNVIEDDLHYWNTELQCVGGVLRPHSISSVVSEILATENCNLMYYSPTSLGYDGPSYNCKMATISKCNVTGQWMEYDPVIEAGCLAYSTLFHLKYRNVFCYLCNTNDTYYSGDCKKPNDNVAADFMALLKFPLEVSTVHVINSSDTCSENQIYDPLKNNCRDISCLFPKTVENGGCVSLVETLKGVTYGMYLKFTPSEDISVSNCSCNFPENLKEMLVSWLNVKVYHSFFVSIYIYAKSNTLSSEIVDGTNNTMAHFIVYIEVVFKQRMNSDVIDYMLAIQDTFFDSGYFTPNGTEVKYKVEIDAHVSDSLAGEYDLILVKEGFKSRYPKTILSVVHTCPFIKINSKELKISRLSHSIFIEEFNATVNENEVVIETITGDGAFSVYMCTHIFKELIEPFIGNEKQLLYIINRPNRCEATEASTNAILSLVCSSISILFSIATLVIYLRFKELKTQPGINNIVLCTTLIIAQTIFQIGSGQSCNVSKLACQIIGVFVHLSWLFLIFWMNSCCVHMFRVFKLGRTRMVSFNTTKTTMIYLLYSFSASVILVAINVTVSLNESNGTEIGYGGSMCYISASDMVAFLFALPVGVVLLINIVLFLAVVIQMTNSQAIQNSKIERNFLHIYAKLSTLTGCTWIFGFLSLFLNVAALEYIFIILNASQGMFLFFAFVANKRTLHFLKDGEHSQTGSTKATKMGISDVKIE